MYFILTLFFVSLIGIIFMVGRQLLLLESGQVFVEETEDKAEYWEELKKWAVVGTRKLGYAILVGIIRLYVKTLALLKSLYGVSEEKVRKMYNKKSPEKMTEKREPNKFLKMVSDSKKKIRKIKQKVAKEEEKS